MSQVMEHVRQLAEVVGPRPATTDAEAAAADYIEEVFRARGLEPERQEFDCPRTRTWAYVCYYLLSVAAAVLARWWPWPAVALGALVAVALWLDLDTRLGLSRFMPKGPSQNVIARHVPRARRGERLRTVVIVAHYDTAKPSLLTSPSLVRDYAGLSAVPRWAIAAVPLVVLAGALPFAADWRPWTWYAALVPAVPLVAAVLIGVHSELFMQATDGANDNASGVAVMLSVMQATVPEPDLAAQRTQPLRRGPAAALEADVVLEDALLEYRQVPEAPARETSLFDSFADVGWETGPVSSAPAASAPRRAAAPAWTPLGDEEPAWESGEDERAVERWVDEEVPETQGRLDFGDEGQPRESGRIFSRRRAGREKGDEAEGRGVRDWLGLGRAFDARKAGREIGSWDRLADEDEDDFGFKAGAAGFDLDVSPAEEAARIRRKVTEGIDRALAEKEVWFVATGAKEAGAWGMRAFLDAYADDLEDALIINVDSVGAGAVAFASEEGVVRRYHCDRRLASQARRTAQELELPVKGRPYRGVATDGGFALARGMRAMTVLAFDINNRLANWHWHTDTIEGVSEGTLETAARFVTELVRDL